MAGKRVNEYRTVEEDQPEKALGNIALAFPSDFVAEQADKAESRSEYKAFLSEVLRLQQKNAR